MCFCTAMRKGRKKMKKNKNSFWQNKPGNESEECQEKVAQIRDDYGVGLGEPKSPDVVKVVRCMDCKYSRNLQTISEKARYRTSCVICTNGEISNTEFAMWGNDFCSYGERKDEREENESR